MVNTIDKSNEATVENACWFEKSCKIIKNTSLKTSADLPLKTSENNLTSIASFKLSIFSFFSKALLSFVNKGFLKFTHVLNLSTGKEESNPSEDEDWEERKN